MENDWEVQLRLVRVPLRISFAGGGSDVPAHYEKWGGAVCSVTINRYIYITAKENTSLFPNKYRLVYSKVEETSDRGDIEHPIIKQLAYDYGVSALDLDVMSDIPAGTGMGSSSAFTVGLHAALGCWMDKHKLAETACYTELIALQEPIGKQDQYASAFGGFNYIKFDTTGAVQVNSLNLRGAARSTLRQRLLLFPVIEKRSASALLRKQDLKNKSLELIAMSDLAEGCAEDLRKGRSIGHVLKEGWELKKRLSDNVSSPLVDAVIAKAMERGANGCKLLGAGGSGFVLVHTDNDPRDVIRGVAELGIGPIDFNWDLEGCKVLYED